jgi:NADP-dependent 3-hydroxy acid dehydrogenase YdfG
MTRTAVVTGASSGIGEASARALAKDGFHVVCAARRQDRIEALAKDIDGTAVVCDVTDTESVARLAASVDSVDVLLNDAGGAFGQATVEKADVEDWARSFDVNALSIVRVTQAMLPALRADGGGLVINMGSTAGQIAYETGGGYTTAKHAVRVITQTLRLELIAEPLRFTEIAPGMVKTEEFTLNRVGGDQAAYDALYAGVPEPLVAEDIAECVRWVASLPAHVNVDEIVVRPRAQATQYKVYRVKDS